MQEKKKKLKEQVPPGYAVALTPPLVRLSARTRSQDPETGSGWMILRQGRWGKGQRVYVQLRGSTLSVFRSPTPIATP